MTPDQAVELTRQALLLSLVIGAPVMIVAVVVGLAISLFQAVTQLQEQTLSFVPKILAMILITLYILPWMFNQMTEYTIELYHNAPMQM